MAVFTTISSASPLRDELINCWADPSDKENATRKISESAKENFLLARAALRALLFQVTAQKNWLLRADLRGKLDCFSENEVRGPAISLSHTRGIVACAISKKGLIGVDIERWRKRDYLALSSYAFGPLEQVAVKQNGAGSFYRIWTLREAVAKATGDGLLARMNGEDCISTKGDQGRFWQFSYSELEPDCSLAIAIKYGDNAGEEPFTPIDIATFL